MVLDYVVLRIDLRCLEFVVGTGLGSQIENREEEGKVVLGLMGIDCCFEEEGNGGLVIEVA